LVGFESGYGAGGRTVTTASGPAIQPTLHKRQPNRRRRRRYSSRTGATLYLLQETEAYFQTVDFPSPREHPEEDRFAGLKSERWRMTSTATAAPTGLRYQHHRPHDHQSRFEYPLPASLIATRPILPLPKRRIASSATPSTNANHSTPGTSTSSSTSIPGTTSPNQIFSHTYPLPASSSSSPTRSRSSLPPYLSLDTQDSESDDEGDEARSTDSSFGREDFNSSNKKKRKIPLSATSNATLNNVIVDGSGGASPGLGTRVLSSKSGLSSAASPGGRYAGWRVPSATMRTEGGYFRRTKARRSVEVEDNMNGVVPAMPGSMPSTPERTAGVAAGEEERTSPAPSALFSFSCPSPLSVPVVSMIPPSVKSSSASMSTVGEVYARQPSAPPTAPLPIPPPPPAPAAVSGQDHIPPQQAYAQTPHVPVQTQTTPHPQVPAQQAGQSTQQPQQQQQQQQPRVPTQGIKHPNSEKARRVAQLTKLRERWRTGPKPEPVVPSKLIYVRVFSDSLLDVLGGNLHLSIL